MRQASVCFVPHVNGKKEFFTSSQNIRAFQVICHALSCASSVDRSLHLTYCLEGADSLCGFMRDRANRTNSFKPIAGLPLAIIVELKPIYAKLSEDDLLRRCLDGKTQNQNEALNGMFWERVPQGVFVGAEVLQLRIYDAQCSPF